MSKIHEVAGMANSSRHPNVKFVDVGYDTILEAKMDLEKGTELRPPIVRASEDFEVSDQIISQSPDSKEQQTITKNPTVLTFIL